MTCAGAGMAWGDDVTLFEGVVVGGRTEEETKVGGGGASGKPQGQKWSQFQAGVNRWMGSTGRGCRAPRAGMDAAAGVAEGH
jgi:hypothetical protein